jgi:DHA1 family bicyclomycin/chloramphenicol resistance-like MFS transporter
MTKKPSFLALILMISFAAVNALLFTPALPNIANFFHVSNEVAQYTFVWFLAAYALGQLIYGPLSNRFGRKPTLYAGVILQIVSSLLCVLAGYLHMYGLLVLGRFLIALGSGVGLKMSFTLVSESYEPKIANQKMSYMMIAFAIAPGVVVALGGYLNQYFGWMSCFYAGAIYGFLLLLLFTRLPETQTKLDYDALKFPHLIQEYKNQFTNKELVCGGLLMGSVSSFFYLFSAVSPFVAINLYGMSSSQFGIANILPPLSLMVGLLYSAKMAVSRSFEELIKKGIIIASIGALLMLIAILIHVPIWMALFLPMVIIYFGMSLVISNGSGIAMKSVTDKAHGAAVMSFINIGFATLIVLIPSFIPISALLLPVIFLVLSGWMFLVYWKLLH